MLVADRGEEIDGVDVYGDRRSLLAVEREVGEKQYDGKKDAWLVFVRCGREFGFMRRFRHRGYQVRSILLHVG